ncbi:MAG: hypothetical protein WDN24_19590 [Sphingomonas sp.]
MLLSGVAASAAQLMAFRFVTGLGIGGCSRRSTRSSPRPRPPSAATWR